MHRRRGGHPPPHNAARFWHLQRHVPPSLPRMMPPPASACYASSRRGYEKLVRAWLQQVSGGDYSARQSGLGGYVMSVWLTAGLEAGGYWVKRAGLMECLICLELNRSLHWLKRCIFDFICLCFWFYIRSYDVPPQLLLQATVLFV